MAGFECQFVERPPQAFQTDCPICLQVLREPHQVTCCGKSYCRECIEPVKDGYQDCPTCNRPNFEMFHNLGLQQSLYDFQVYCSHKSKGCEWTGELRELDNHLNSDPPADKSLEGCPFTVINCPLSHAGCEVRPTRKDVSTHLAEAAVTHTLMQSAAVQRLLSENQSLTRRLHSVETKNQRLEHNVADLLVDKVKLQERVTALEDVVKELDGSVHKFIMPSFYKYRHENKEWSSVPFYTHPQGYNMCLVCNATGTGGNAYLSVYVCLMHGQYDDFLEWPLRGEMTIHLLDQTGSERHHVHRVKFDGTSSNAALGRVKRSRLRAETGVGFPQFIPLHDLHPRYLKNDCLVFKITDVKVR